MTAARRRAGWGLWLALACGRTQLDPGSVAAGGHPQGGGGEANVAGGPGLAGSPRGGSATGGGTGGDHAGATAAGAPAVCDLECGEGERCVEGRCACANERVTLRETTPAPAALDVRRRGAVTAVFDCAIDEGLRNSEHARLYGAFNGDVRVSFPRSADHRLVLRPERAGSKPPFFAGELVTAWLGAPLGGARLWQYVTAVDSSSSATFVAGQVMPTLTRAGRIALGDLDADADLDLVVMVDSHTLVLPNDGTGRFGEPEPLLLMGEPALADVDRDGDLDVVSNVGFTRNDGNRRFGPVEPLAGCVSFGDVDGDGDGDCLANRGYAESEPFGQVLLNDGRGSFSEGSSAAFGFDCEVADLDGDSDLDAMCVTPVVEPARVFLNDGHGAFTRTEQVLGEPGTRAIAVGDLDGDGDVDAVGSQWYGGGRTTSNQVWLNDGGGRFSVQGSIGANGGDIELGDLDGDGDLDVVFSELTPYGPSHGPLNPARIYLNDGGATFSRGPGTLGDPAFHWLELGDLDGDGDLDAFVFHQIGVSGNYSSVWLSED